MGVIYCASCEGKVSDMLDVCPHCGHPLSAAGIDKVLAAKSPPPAIVPPEVQTIEKTSKKWKGAQLISAAIAIIGLLTAFTADPAAMAVGTTMLMLGIVMFIVFKIIAWWHHG